MRLIHYSLYLCTFSVNIYLFKINIEKGRYSSAMTFSLEHISHLFSSVSIVDFEQLIVCWITVALLQEKASFFMKRQFPLAW